MYSCNFKQSWNFCLLLDVQRSYEYAHKPSLKGDFIGEIRFIDITGKVVTGGGYGQELVGSRNNLKIRQHFRQ